MRDDINAVKLVQLLNEYSPPSTEAHMLFLLSPTQPSRVGEFSQKLIEAFHQDT